MLYELVVDQRYAGQQCINRFNYVLTGTPASVTGAFALVYAAGFVPDQGVFPSDTLFHRIRQIQSLNVTTREIVCKAVYDNVDFYTLPYLQAVPGLNNQGEDLPAFVAYGFRTSRVRTDIRRGQKRFVGVQEGNTANGGQIDPTMLAAMQQLAEKMSGALTYNDEGNTLTFTPVIVSRQKYQPQSGGGFAYRYYPTWAEQQGKLATGMLWTPINTLRSQTSRQYGRGS